jgi:hypothetical protein
MFYVSNNSSIDNTLLTKANSLPEHECIYLSVHGRNLTELEFDKHIEVINTLNHKCVKCDITNVLYRHKICRKCYTNVFWIKEPPYFVQYYIYSQIPCFCIDCLDYYGMSVNIHKDFITKNNANKKSQEKLHNAEISKYDNRIKILNLSIEAINSNLKNSNKLNNDMVKETDKEIKRLQKINEDSIKKMDEYKTQFDKSQKKIDDYKSLMKALRDDNFFNE